MCCDLHGYQAVAALKHRRPGWLGVAEVDLHGYQAVAALKPIPGRRQRGRRGPGSPRLSGRGRIEAEPVPRERKDAMRISTAIRPWPH